MKKASLLSILLGLLLALAPCRAETLQPPTMYVTGQASLFEEPDSASATIGFEQSSPTAGAAQNAVSIKLNSFISAAKALGLKSAEMQSKQLSLQPVYEENDYNRRKIISYLAEQRLEVTLKGEERLLLLPKLLELAAKQQLNNIDGLSFFFSPELKATLQEKAVQEAAKNALETGKAVLKSLNLNFKGIKSIRLAGQYSSPRQYQRSMIADAAPMAMMSKSAPELQSGQEELSASVDLELLFDN